VFATLLLAKVNHRSALARCWASIIVITLDAIERIESPHPSLRFRILLGNDDVQVIRIGQRTRS
jgi:hypothetical protein